MTADPGRARPSRSAPAPGPAINRVLPQEASPEHHRGSESETPLTRSWLTGLTQRAARQHNEVETPAP